MLHWNMRLFDFVYTIYKERLHELHLSALYAYIERETYFPLVYTVKVKVKLPPNLTCVCGFVKLIF